MSYAYDLGSHAVWGDISPSNTDTLYKEPKEKEDQLSNQTALNIETPANSHPNTNPQEEIDIGIAEEQENKSSPDDQNLVEKVRVCENIQKLQTSLKDLVSRVKTVKDEHANMQAENKILENYVANLSSNVLSSR